MNRKVLILGAGISGLSLGWKLASEGMKVDVLEASPAVGGLAGTVREDGYCLDFGPHSFFTEDDEIRETVLSLFDGGLQAKPRTVKFHYKGKLLDYPITAQSILFQMGPASAFAAVRDFLIGRWFSRKRRPLDPDEESVEDWALAQFGNHLYESFFKPYTEQFWKISCCELSSRSIPTHTRLSFMHTLRSLLTKPFSAKGGSQIDREKLPTYYPPTGYAEISEKIASRFLAAGGRLLLSSRASQMELMEGGGVKIIYEREGLQSGLEADYAVSTLPISLLLPMMRPSLSETILTAASRLEFRPLLMLAMVTEKQNVLDADYMYTLDRPYNRIVEMNKFSPATSPAGENILAVEIPCLRNSPEWSASKEELFEMCLSSLTRDGILKREEVKKLFLVKAPFAYPIYRKGYARHLQVARDAVDMLPNVFTLGRGGEFRYMDADQCMRRAFDLAERIQCLIKAESLEADSLESYDSLSLKKI